uniref:Uncharacterized protein n=1 Tax=Cynoglossus semilaevis TaxID=244447 RepID=A0A3P8WR92_CYNSE
MFLKNILYFFNLFFVAVLCVILLAVGVWAKVSLNSYDFVISEKSTIASYVLIGTGAVIVVFGLFGCIATCKGSPWLLKLYGFCSMLAMLAAGTSGFLFRPKVRNTVANFFTKAVKHHSTSDSVSTLVDTMQRNLQCCGVSLRWDLNHQSLLTTVMIQSCPSPSSNHAATHCNFAPGWISLSHIYFGILMGIIKAHIVSFAFVRSKCPCFGFIRNWWED